MRLLWSLVRQIRTWDRVSQSALAFALVLLAIALVILTTRPDLRTPASIGAVGLMLAVQGIILWGNRNLVMPYTQAQRHFMRGDFAAARDVLLGEIDEEAAKDSRPGVDSYVLLGNAYRNLGQLSESETTLREALEIREDYHFALYGLGKTQLAQGEYDEAFQTLQRAGWAGAPDVVQFDLAHVQMRRGLFEQARQLLDTLPPQEEPYRQLMIAHWQHTLNNAPAPDDALIQNGLPFWQAESERFAHTLYGRDVLNDVNSIAELSGNCL